ncbi:hypothetical protein [Deinococcus sp. QL22]|uniref:hypothetical protein n=1 Tax=Deinococcus sp. QL22 TaxID=2939437 RepID=UPI00201809D1|nr:hypothetical protein [Deinococcus sp. QL22]UQN10366.1 hypothetical protein M1R55_29890 [Deinococcus sp. QL22]UQN10500.1 hypothetical protein M1R55_29215 [Deinococcus sp. QL22]
MIWRDVWNDTPRLVILSEEDAQDGVIEDAVLFLLELLPSPVTVSDAEGHRLSVTLPLDLPEGVGMYPHIDLPVETPNEEKQIDSDHPLP